MADPVATLTSIFTLLGTASLMIVVALILTSFNALNPKWGKNKTSARVAIGLIFGLLAILGTVMGTKMADGTIINVRELATMIAGLAGGPIGGVLAGLIGGLHRYTAGGATALPCTISTILVGTISGLVSAKILTGKLYVPKGALMAIALECMAMGLILALVPLNQAISIVEKIAIPMITANAVGFVLWLYLAHKWSQH